MLINAKIVRIREIPALFGEIKKNVGNWEIPVRDFCPGLSFPAVKPQFHSCIVGIGRPDAVVDLPAVDKRSSHTMGYLHAGIWCPVISRLVAVGKVRYGVGVYDCLR